MKGTDIINVAREQLKSFITFEVRNIYLLLNGQEPNFEEDEEYVLDVDGLSVKVEVDDSYLMDDERVFEDWTISEVHLSLDGTIILFGGDNNDEVYADDITTDELANLANVLEKRYLEIVKANTI